VTPGTRQSYAYFPEIGSKCEYFIPDIHEPKVPGRNPRGQEKALANLSLPNKHGVIIGHGERRNTKGALMRFYIVETTHSSRPEEWAPGITYPLDADIKDNVAFV
jgi:hypothetical protein